MVHLSSFYRHLLTVAIFGIGYIMLGWVLYSLVLKDLSWIDMEKQGLQYQEHLRDLLLNVNTHKYLLQRYYRGNTTLKNQILNVQVAANEDLRYMERDEGILRELIAEQPEKSLIQLPQASQPSEIVAKWKEIRRLSFDTNAKTNEKQHDELIENVLGLIDYTARVSHLTQDPSLVVYGLVESTSRLLPEIQLNLAHIMNLMRESDPSERDELVGLVAVLENNVERSDVMIPSAISMLADRPDLRDPLAEAYGAYTQAIGGVVEYFRDTGQGEDAESNFQGMAIRALNETFVLWDVIAKITRQLIDERGAEIRRATMFVAAVTLSVIFFGFFLGAYFVSEAQKTLTHLKETSIKISRGDLSARVPVRHRDEMGKVCVIFNHMARTLERMMRQFKQLIHATQKLANGDFSARLEVDSTTDDEIQAVGVSFNRMAESFEKVVSSLHRLVIDLTSSATQISAASKQHEASLSEQGATTKQISVTATEISATSKDFSKTLTEVGGVADETARLARMGQSSLIRMEQAMKKMEDAATNITTRLADLNEKASNITSVITTISEVSAQTNLLSLNAAIEAEKAGQAGRSFAVIAREIRGLSNQTAMSTLDIEKIVNEIVDAVKSSVMGVDDFTTEIREGTNNVKEVSEQLSQIMEKVKILVERFDTVDYGMKNQSEAAEQINKALIDLSEMATETSLSMSHFHSTISHLDKAATDLRVTLERIH